MLLKNEIIIIENIFIYAYTYKFIIYIYLYFINLAIIELLVLLLKMQIVYKATDLNLFFIFLSNFI